MFHLYAMDIAELVKALLCGLFLWTILLFLTEKNEATRRGFKLICGIISLIALYGILSYTVLRRIPSDNHRFTLFAAYSNEFWREMFMNGLLYVPFGVSVSVLIGPWSVLAALILSVVIESWQFFAGTGLAQGSDVLMNTLGAAIGLIPYMVVKKLTSINGREKSDN